MVTTIVDEVNFGVLDQVKWSDLVFSQYISQTLIKLLILKLIFHLYNTIRIFRMRKSLNATYTFGHKVKLTYSTTNKSK